MAERKKGGCGCAIAGCLLVLVLGAIGVGILLTIGGAGALYLVAGSRSPDWTEMQPVEAPSVAPPPVVEMPAPPPAEEGAGEGAAEEGVGEGAAEEEPETVAESPGSAEPVPEKPAATTTPEKPAPTATTEPTPSRIRTPTPTAEPTSPTPPPETASTPAPSGTQVNLEGNAKVVLVSGGKRYPIPGRVPPGSYDIEATFSDGVPVNVGRMTVGEGGSHVVRCNENMGICRGS